MGGFLSFVKKEALHILRDRRTMLLVLIMPVMQIMLFGFAISTEVRNVNVAVVAPDRGEAVRRVVERIDANEYFAFRGFVTQPDIDHVLRSGQADVVAVFDGSFGYPSDGTAGPSVQLIADASNPNNSTAGAAYLQSVIFADAAPAVLQSEVRTLYNPQMISAYNFVPGIMGLIFILICALMTSVSIVREKEMGTMEVLLVSPVRPVWIVFAKMIPYFLLSCVNLVVIMLLSRYLLDVPMAGSMVGLIVISLLYIVLALALGLLISTFADRQVTAMLISGMLLMMPIMMLSGMLFPVENMPEVLQGISYIVPARWYIAAMRKLMIEGLPFGEVFTEFCVLAAMTTVLITVALRKFNDKLE